jgi:hypothetical protein
MTPVPDAVLPTMAQVQSVKEALAPWAARQMYLNFADTEMYEAPMWPAETFTRLREIKAKADPANMIRANHPVPPAE